MLMPILLNCYGMKQTKSLKSIVALYELNLALFLLLSKRICAPEVLSTSEKRSLHGKKEKNTPDPNPELQKRGSHLQTR
jgi:hypothetical protein